MSRPLRRVVKSIETLFTPNLKKKNFFLKIYKYKDGKNNEI